jgi:hypothetical protein
MMTMRVWLRKTYLLKLIVVAIAAIAAIGGTALAAGPFGSVAKKRCDQTCQETKLFNSLYDAKIAKAHVAFATAATSASSAGSASTAGTVTGTINGTHVSGVVANATNATNATNAINATNAANVTGTINGTQVSGVVANATDATTAANAANVDGHTFTQINASAGSYDAATLLNDFEGLTLQCTGPAGTEGTVTLEIVNSSQATGSFGAGEVDGAGTARFDEGPVNAAEGSIPVATNFTFPIHSGAQVSFSFTMPVGSTTDVVSGTFTMVIDNGCTAFGNADASSVAQ